MKLLLILTLLLAAGYGTLCLYLFLTQESRIYLPRRELVATPQDLGLSFAVRRFPAADGVQLYAWWLPGKPDRSTVLYLHGNGGNLSYHLEHIALFARAGYGVLAADYRGYGNSEGRPGEDGSYRDARAAWDHLTQVLGVPPDRILIYGHSLGSAIAAHLATEVEPRALLVEGGFVSVPERAAELYPWLPVRLLARIRYPTAEFLGRATCPVTVLHARDDEIIPYAHGERLFAAAAHPQAFIPLHGGHNDAMRAAPGAILTALDAATH